VTLPRIAPNPLKYFGVEYSIKDNSVHRRTLENVIDNNLSNLRKGHSSDFVLVALVPSRETADWFIEQFNHTIATQAHEAFAGDNWQRVTDVIQFLVKQILERESAPAENSAC
jgi:hypothetical protein